MAIILAIASWYMVTGREKVETWVEVPIVTAKTPKGLVIREGLLNKIQVKLRGPKGMLHNLDAERLSYICDLGQIEPGRSVVALRPEAVKTQGAIAVTEIKPSKMVIEVEQVVTKKLPVKPVWKGTLPKNWQLQDGTAYPPDVTVSGPESVINSMQAVYTQEYIVSANMTGQIVGKAPLLLPEEVEAVPNEVGVRFIFGPDMVDIWVNKDVEIPAVHRNRKSKITITPHRVRLRLEIPEHMVRDENFYKAVTVHLPEDTDMSPGTRDTLYRVNLPMEAHLLQAQPQTVKVKIAR